MISTIMRLSPFPMKIFDLPQRQKIAYLDVQYFNNPPKRGVSAHVIKVQYKVRASDKMRSFIIPITNETRNINRNAKKQLDATAALWVKTKSKEMKKNGIVHFFGFRQVTVTERTDTGRLFHRQQDPNTMCWVTVVDDETLKVKILWGDDWITIPVHFHKNGSVNKQSIGIGYYDINDELRANIERIKRANGVSAEATEEESQEPECPRACLEEPMADARRNCEASSMGDNHTLPVAVQTALDEEEPSIARPRVERKPTSRTKKSSTSRDFGGMVDQREFGVWQPEEVCDFSNGLGTSFRIPDSI